MTPPLRIGVIGCGNISQSIHLPLLSRLSGHGVALTSICDADPDVLAAVGTRFSIASRYTSYEELCRDPSIDAVLIATAHHVRPALCAIDHGKHLLVEKPLCTNPLAGREVVRAARRAGVTAMVGYMKRYDASYEFAVATVKRLPKVRLSRVHDFAARHGRTADLFSVVRARSDALQDAMSDAQAEGTIDGLRPRTIRLLERLTKFACHDVNLAQGVFGQPSRVLSATLVDSETIVAILGYPRSGPCVLELSVGTKYEWFDESLVVYGDDSRIALRFADPFIPFAQSEVEVRTAAPIGGARDTLLRGSLADGFRREWLHFADCVRLRSRPTTDLETSLQDIELLVEIARMVDGSEMWSAPPKS